MTRNIVNILNILQGIACIILAALAECDAIANLAPVLLALGCCLVLSGTCHVELASNANGILYFVNLVYTAIVVTIVWLAVLTWGESDRLWDGGKDCDGWLFSFVFIYTVVAIAEIGCVILFLRFDPTPLERPLSQSIV